MSQPFLGEIKVVAFNFPPKGWALSNGQLLPITQNTALFSLLGTTYGGDGVRTFALPNFQGRIGVGPSSAFPLGQLGGSTAVTLTGSNLPAHTHALNSASQGTSPSPAGGFPAAPHVPAPFAKMFAASSNAAMDPSAVAAAGGSQPHDNMMPYLVVNFVIALQGIFPSRP